MASAALAAASAPLLAAAAVAPLLAFQAAAFRAFCRGEWAQPPPSPPSSLQPASPRPWCATALPYAYGFVQSEYWGVGFLRYWTLSQARQRPYTCSCDTVTPYVPRTRLHAQFQHSGSASCQQHNVHFVPERPTRPQLPNFLLAGPVLALSLGGLLEFGAANGRWLASLGLACSPGCWGGEEEDCRPGGAGVGSSSSGGPSERPGSARAGDRGDLKEKGADVAAPLRPAGDAGGVRRRAAVGPGDAASGVARGRSAGAASQPAGSGHALEASHGEIGFLRPQLAVFLLPWAVSVGVALTAMHVQVATRLLLSSCPPLYWYMAHVWRRCSSRRQGEACGREGRTAAWGADPGSSRGCSAACAAGLWRWCLVYMALGAVLFCNFMPWT